MALGSHGGGLHTFVLVLSVSRTGHGRTEMVRCGEALLLALAVFSCARASAPPVDTFNVTAVFVGFYDRRVMLSINDEVVLDERLNVDDASTELSESRPVHLRQRNQIVLSVDGAEIANLEIDADASARTLFVENGAEPPVWISEFAPSLD